MEDSIFPLAEGNEGLLERVAFDTGVLCCDPGERILKRYACAVVGRNFKSLENTELHVPSCFVCPPFEIQVNLIPRATTVRIFLLL